MSARTGLERLSSDAAFVLGTNLSILLIALLFWQFYSSFCAPFGYTFTVVDNQRTDVNWYLGEFGSEMSFGRMIPLILVSGFGPILGPLFISLYVVYGTMIALRGIALSRKIKLTWKDAALMDLLAFPVLFHMISMGYYSQMLAGTFILFALMLRDRKGELVCLLLAAMSHPDGIWIAMFYLLQPFATWVVDYLKTTRIAEYIIAILGSIAILFNSYVWQALFNHLAYTIPKSFLFLGQNAWLKMKVRCPQISAWVLASLGLIFIDYNARTIFFAYLLSVPFILEALNDRKIVPSKMKTTWIAIFFFEAVLSCMWSLIFYSQFL